jgi:DNA-binding response OmpR family regulator
LNRFGFDVAEANTGEGALAVLEACRPHVAIAELTLPRDDEFQLRVRTATIPYIVTTTNDTLAAPPDAVSVLMKPFSLQTLLEEVRRSLRARKGRSTSGVGEDGD